MNEPEGYVHSKQYANMHSSPSLNGKARGPESGDRSDAHDQEAARARLWDVSIDLLGILDARGCFESTNPAWGRALGWTAGEIRQMSIFELIHPDDVLKVRAGLRDVTAGEPVLHFESRFRRSDHDYRWLSWVAVSEEEKFYCSARDVTQEREARTELAAALDALRQSQKMEAVGHLTGGIAHDFNNLLTAISGSLELLENRLTQGRLTDAQRYIAAARSASKRAAALTHRLLAFARRQTLDPKPTNVNRLVGEMEELIRRTVSPSVRVEVVGAGNIWSTRVDPNQLENALLNLCINARDAMPEGGSLMIESSNQWVDERGARERDVPPGQYVTLSVTDTGTGMTPEVIARAFDPFFTTKPLGAGTGLGLSMIYGFARQSGGQVRIYSEVGHGATVCLYLPRHIGEADTADAQPELSDVAHATQGETVLVVDDEPIVRMLVVDVLEELGYTAIEAGDGHAGIKVLQSAARVDLLITDIGLPGGLNGRQVADAARKLRPDLKVLFITGYAENAVLSHGRIDAGMHVLTKPFAMEGLASRIRDVLAQRAA
jgi:PAS domain S-box-containing protein